MDSYDRYMAATDRFQDAQKRLEMARVDVRDWEHDLAVASDEMEAAYADYRRDTGLPVLPRGPEQTRSEWTRDVLCEIRDLLRQYRDYNADVAATGNGMHESSLMSSDRADALLRDLIRRYDEMSRPGSRRTGIVYQANYD